MNKEELQQKIVEYYGKLSPKAQQVFSSMQWLETLRKITTKHSFTEEQIQTIGTETMLVLLGIIHFDEYEKLLKEELKLPNDITENVLEEVNTLILNPIIKELSESYNKNIENDEKIMKQAEEGEKVIRNPIEVKVDSRFANLPNEIKEIIDKSNYVSKVYIIAKENNLSLTQITTLEEIVTNNLLGIVQNNSYNNQTVNTLGVNEDQFKVIINEINEKILKDIKNQVISLNHKKEEGGMNIIKETSDQPEEVKEKINIDIHDENTSPKDEEVRVDTTQTPEIPKTSILNAKLSGAFKINGVKTEHSLSTLSKQNDPMPVEKKIDPYREIPE